MIQVNNYFVFAARILAAVILLQTLYFKFTGAPESVYIFTKLGVEPWGRIGSGFIELIAGILLLISAYSWIGAVMALTVMLGAVLSHLTILGIEIQHDKGYLFLLAIVVASCSLVILYYQKNIVIMNVKAILSKF